MSDEILNINKKRNTAINLSQINEFQNARAAITSELVIDILKKQPFEKKPRDYSILNDYILFISKFTEQFRKQKIPQSSYEKMVLLSLQSCKLKVFLANNSQIYTPETEANYIYIVLKGSVKLIKIQKQLIKFKPFDYYHLIINLRNKKESYILKNTINENSAIYPIDISDIDYLEKILLKILIINRKEDENDYDYLDKIIKKVGLTYEQLNLKCSYREELSKKNEAIQKENIELINQGKGAKCKGLIPYNNKEAEEYVTEQERIIFDQLNFINFDICQKYTFFTYEKEEFITVFELNEDKIIKVNEYFGENFENKYTDFAVSAEDDLYLLLIKNTMINQVIDNEKDKITTNQTEFFINNFFFRSIKKYIFERYYLNFFELENYQPGQKICNENESVKYLFFIKKGRVRLSYKKSILEIHSLINIIKERIKQKKLEEENNNDNESDIIKFLDNNPNIYNLSGNFDSIKSELNTKQERNIMVYQQNQCLGYECYYYGLKYLYTAIAASDRVEIYKISITQLAKIFHNKNEKCFIDLAKRAEETLFFLMKRFIKINNLMMEFLEKRKEAEQEAEKTQAVEIVNPRKVFLYKNKRQNIKPIIVKKSEISKILPSLIKKKTSSKIIDNSYLNNDTLYLSKKLPTLSNYNNNNESSNQASSIINIAEYEKNIFNNKSQLSGIEKRDKYTKLKSQLFYNKLNQKRRVKLFLTRAKLNNFNKSGDNSFNNSSYNNSYHLKESNRFSNLSCIPLRNSNFESRIIEDDSLNENNISTFISKSRLNNQSALLPLNLMNNQKKLIKNKLQNFINIKKKLIIKKNKIYKDQKDKIKSMINNYYIEE